MEVPPNKLLKSVFDSLIFLLKLVETQTRRFSRVTAGSRFYFWLSMVRCCRCTWHIFTHIEGIRRPKLVVFHKNKWSGRQLEWKARGI